MSNNAKTTPLTEAQLLPLAEAGDICAALELAKLYLINHNPELYKWANTLCDRNMAEGYYLLGKCYEFGIAVEEDHAEAERLYRQSAAMDFPRALVGIVSLYLSDPEKRDAKIPEIIRLLKQAISKGDEKAMYVLSYFYRTGEGVARSRSKQIELLYSSSEQGFAPAMAALGDIYTTDPEYREEGIEWLKKAVELGETSAQEILDSLSWREACGDYNQPEDSAFSPETLEILDRLNLDSIERLPIKEQMIAAAETGDPQAQYTLGKAYLRGETEDYIMFDKDIVEARKWLEKAAIQGHAMASFVLGEIAKEEQDYETAISWYLRAASNGLTEAYTDLGATYAVTKQYDKAVHWLKKGVDMGDASSMSRLGALYSCGRGVPLDMDEAIRLYTISAEAGDSYGCLCLSNIYLRPEYLNVPAAEAMLIELANKEDPEAQTLLAQIYLGMHGKEFTDLAIADDLLISAVDLGNIEAAYLLGIYYYTIVGNKELAYKILSLAAANGNEAAMTALNNLFGTN